MIKNIQEEILKIKKEKNSLQHLPDVKFGENPDEFEV